MNFKSGYVTIIGVPNAGKSSLVNALVRESVSIVSAKPQTTRKRTLGILTDPGHYQIVFVDTPGVLESAPPTGLNPFLHKELESALSDVDVIVAAIAPWELQSKEKPWALKVTEKMRCSVLFVATQSDKRSSVANWHALSEKPLLQVSSLTREGIQELKDAIVARLPGGDAFFDEEIYTTQNLRELAAETVRKYCFDFLHQEVPYGLAVAVKKFVEGQDLYKIEADILVSKESHRGIVIGVGGKTLKTIGTQARKDLEKMFGIKVFLHLRVVVKPNWLKDKNWLMELGYAAQ